LEEDRKREREHIWVHQANLNVFTILLVVGSKQ